MIAQILLLLVLSMVALAHEVAAQDAECVRERAAMVENVNAYARSYVNALATGKKASRIYIEGE